ncbi:hypothetical protein [Spirosoma oryzicola]|uniref:hypothetical protein n=1 Tax=Spirosoma oryzicola TaxID=2898794 RepID=UPI001E44FD7F|nr:hypothetical protein [Spirosoma oryzicola]UHG93310.1 hypothetical protein LQ777_10500 [Spirosoma oryzicola]
MSLQTELPGQDLEGLTPEEREIVEQQQKLNEQLRQINAKKQEDAQKERQKKLDSYNKLLKSAKDFRSQSLTMTDRQDAEERNAWAEEAELEAHLLAMELGIKTETAVVQEIEPEIWQRPGLRRRLVWGALGALIIFLVWSYGCFQDIRHTILNSNAKLPLEQQAQPYDATSFQKFFFEKFVELIDLPTLLIKLLIVAPFVAFYLLPVFKTKRDFITEFFEDLTPWQRSILTVLLLGLLLLHSALSHSVKP